MIACHNITRIIHYIIVSVICKSHLVSDYFPYNFWFRKILPITDAILRFKPLVTSFLPSFDFFAINNMSFSCLFQTLYTNREKIIFHRRIAFYVIMSRRKCGNNPQIRPLIFISLNVPATKNRSLCFYHKSFDKSGKRISIYFTNFSDFAL